MLNVMKFNAQEAKIFIIILLTLFSSVAWTLDGPELTSDNKAHWDQVRLAFEAFYENPSQKEAERILKVMPEKRGIDSTVEERKAFEIIFDECNYEIFRNEIYSGNKTCLEIAFRLYEFSDGHYAEQLCVTIGILIRINPELFLSGLNKYRHIFEDREIPYPVGVLPSAYVDRFKAQKHEIEKRIEALQKVNIADYIDIRNRCIKQLVEIKQKIEISLLEMREVVAR
ncbi:MAG: hypothetical protein H5U07_02680 [Candidatus Aminicenantes bacterium]|nr:hypothetical protein [Candidatus Aminicenantes bacterium]